MTPSKPKPPPALYDPTEKTVGKLDYYYKVVAEDGFDLYSRTFSYPECVGLCAYIAGKEGTEKAKLCSPTVLHASPSLPFALFYGIQLLGRSAVPVRDGKRGFIRPSSGAPPKRFRVFELYGEPVATNTEEGKFGFREFDVIREVAAKTELVKLLRADINGVAHINGHNKLPQRAFTPTEANDLYMWAFDPKVKEFINRPRFRQ